MKVEMMIDESKMKNEEENEEDVNKINFENKDDDPWRGSSQSQNSKKSSKQHHKQKEDEGKIKFSRYMLWMKDHKRVNMKFIMTSRI